MSTRTRAPSPVLHSLHPVHAQPPSPIFISFSSPPSSPSFSFHPTLALLSPPLLLPFPPLPLPLLPSGRRRRKQRQPAAGWRPGAGWRRDGGRAWASGMEAGRWRPGAGQRDGGWSPAASPSPPSDPAGGEATGWVAGLRRDGRPAGETIFLSFFMICGLNVLICE